MFCELLQPYPLSRQTREFPLRYWFGSDYRGSGGWTSSQEKAQKEKGELVGSYSCYPAQIPALGKNTLLSML